MELWIRSQDKMKIVKVNSIIILDNGLTFHGYINDKDHFWLGTYNSKERALEVLDEIEKSLRTQIFIQQHNPVGEIDENLVYKIEDFKCDIQEISTVVHQMPKE